MPLPEEIPFVVDPQNEGSIMIAIGNVHLSVKNTDGTTPDAQGGGVIFFDQSGGQAPQHRPTDGDGKANFGTFAAAGMDFFATAYGCQPKHGYVTADPTAVVPGFIYLAADPLEIPLDPI